MKVQEVLSCSFSSWYPKFKAITMKSAILDLTPEFLEYLHSDGTLVLPEHTTLHTNREGFQGDSDDETDWDTGNSDTAASAPSFPDFENEIKRAIARLGGGVFPKLNWSSPKDATWIALNNSLKCTQPSDIYLLLKSSQFVTHDLTQPFSDCENVETANTQIKHQLILRQWHDINPGGEFRCFVRNHKLIGICQRHINNFYHFIPTHQEEILVDITEFYNKSIKSKFPEESYVFDVYRTDKNKVYLLDFNPFGEVTDGLMFTWEELQDCNRSLSHTHGDATNLPEMPCLRFIKDSEGVQPSPYRSYAIPQDFVDLSTGSDPFKLMDFLNLKEQIQREESYSDEDSNSLPPPGPCSPSESLSHAPVDSQGSIQDSSNDS